MTMRSIVGGCFLLLPSLPTTYALTTLKMSGGMEQIANFAVRQSPSSTRFVTNAKCPFAQKVWIGLEVAQAPYDIEQVDLYGPDGKPDWFLELNPEGMVPVLECYGGAVVIHDSDLILDQIALGVVEGGKRLAIADEQEASLVQGWRTRINDMLPVGKGAVQGDASQQNMLMKVLCSWDSQVVGPYLCGDKVTLADCGAFPFVWRLDLEFGLESMECKRLKDWLTTCEANAAFGKTIESSWWWWW